MNNFYKSIVLALISLLAIAPCANADYQADVDAKNAEIAAAQAVIDQRTGLIDDAQTDIDAHQRSLTETQKIYEIGLQKYKGMIGMAEAIYIVKKLSGVQ